MRTTPLAANDLAKAVIDGALMVFRSNKGWADKAVAQLADDDFEAAVPIAQAEYDRHRPAVVVGPSRGGAVAMSLDSGDTPLVLLCPAWRKWGTARTVKPDTVILHSRADDVVPFAHSTELVRNSGLPAAALIEVGSDHRLADPEPLGALLRACEAARGTG